jgi:hypothetical protein
MKVILDWIKLKIKFINRRKRMIRVANEAISLIDTHKNKIGEDILPEGYTKKVPHIRASIAVLIVGQIMEEYGINSFTDYTGKKVWGKLLRENKK